MPLHTPPSPSPARSGASQPTTHPPVASAASSTTPPLDPISGSVDRVEVYERALAGLRRHLLPLLRGDLQEVARRTKIPPETLRKRRRELEKGTRSLPDVDALMAIAEAYGWSLDAMLDGACEAPDGRPAAPAGPVDVAAVLHAHLTSVITSAVRRSKPWAIDMVLSDDADCLLKQVENQVVERVHVMVAERERRQQAQDEEDLVFAKAHLAGPGAVRRITETHPALAPWAEAAVLRIQHALAQGSWNFMEGRCVFPAVAVRGTDPWDLARGIEPTIDALAPLIGSRIRDALVVAFEVTNAEVAMARGALSRSAGRGAGMRACKPHEVLDAFDEVRRGRPLPPNGPQSLAAICQAAHVGAAGPEYDMWAFHDWFAAFCVRVGLVWHAEAGHFTLLTTPGGGRFDARLAPHPREPKFVIVPWRAEYWKAAARPAPSA